MIHIAAYRTKAIRLFGVMLVVLATSFGHAQLTLKEQAVLDLRTYFSKHAYRGYQLVKSKVEQFTPEQCINLLSSDGRFSDLIEVQNEIESEKLNQLDSTQPQRMVGDMLQKAFNRMWRIAQTYRGKSYSEYANDETLIKLYKAINNYSKIEADRGSIGSGRFHISCFAIPTAAVNTYFCLLDAMDHIEQGQEKNEIAKQANRSLIQMSYQSWTQPHRSKRRN